MPFDPTYSVKTYRDKQGDRMVIAPGGELQIGNASFTVNATGQVIVTGLPTTDPHIAGALYLNNGVLTVSAG